MVGCTGQFREEKQDTAVHSSGHLLVEAVLAVGKAVWNTIVLLKLSGPAQPHNNPLFFKLRHWGTKQSCPSDSFLWAMPSELGKCPLFLVYFFMFFYLLLFSSKMVCVAVCRLELNAADWNLNCDLAVANCESAAELPIKPFSSSRSGFLFVSWLVCFYHFVCLDFCYFKNLDQPFVRLSYVFGDILVYIKHIFLFFTKHGHFSFWLLSMLCIYRFKFWII